jgi:Flp pilus assembly protein TadD
MLALLAGAALLSGFVLLLPLEAQTQQVQREELGTGARMTQTVSADLLRHPISPKTLSRLKRAVDWMRSGKHQEAIQQLEDTLAKDPSSAAYVHSLLGYEYMKMDRFTAAVTCFEQAVSLLPHDAINRTNFGVSLAAIGDYKRAEEQVRRAQELEPKNPEIRRFLDAVLTYNRSVAQDR